MFDFSLILWTLDGSPMVSYLFRYETTEGSCIMPGEGAKNDHCLTLFGVDL